MGWRTEVRSRVTTLGKKRVIAGLLLLVSALLFAGVLPAAARGKDKLHYGEGLIVNIPFPESEVEQVVTDLTQNGVIRGTKEYNKDEYVGGAQAASSSRVFPAWNEGGKVFYKVREHAIDPRNFKDGGDVGTLVVRYVVQPQGDKNTVLRIDALFEEEFRHTVHQSDGSVESAEYKDIQEHLENIEVMKQQTLESEKEREERLAKKQLQAMQNDLPYLQSAPAPVADSGDSQKNPASSSSSQAAAAVVEQPTRVEVSPPNETPRDTPQPAAGPAAPSVSLAEHVKDLRKQVERLVKAPGAPLKSAPFHTASNLQSLPTGTEILVLISTPYWYGVETHDGQHGWIMRDQLEQP